MLQHIGPPPPSNNQNLERNHLARVRRRARQRGLRILKDFTGRYNLVDTHVEPPRALAGLEHSSLDVIENALAVPLPPPRPPRKPQMARLEGNGSSQPSQASHPAVSSFSVLVEDLLKRSAS
jgi:hypothetical protein